MKVLYESEASYEPEDRADYPPVGANSIYSAILSRNEAVKDAKRLKTFLELRDKYVKKNVIFEDPLFPADNSSLFYSHKPSMKIEWKRPSVSATSLSLFSKIPLHLITTSNTHEWSVKLIRLHVCRSIALVCHLLKSQTADPGHPVCWET